MKFSKYIVLPLLAMLLASCGEEGTSSSTSKSGGGSLPIDPDRPLVANDSYYDLSKYALNDKVGGELMFEVHRLLLDTHSALIPYADFTKYVTVDSSGAKTDTSIDQFDKNTQTNDLFYTGKQISLGSSSYTREHVWPCAKSGGMWVHSGYKDPKYYVDSGYYVGGGSDLYHVRPCTNSVNTARGDSRYREFTEAEKAAAYKATDGGSYTLYCDKSEFANYSEPADQYKGDIVRILMYVYIHYSKIGNYNWNDYCGTLNLQDVMGYNSSADVYEAMVRWNELDPVSETEKLRNDTVQKIQGTRNPFVDYPHLMKYCFNLQ